MESFRQAKNFLDEQGIACHAGHGLTHKSTQFLANTELFEEYNIGHWVISQSVFYGLPSVVKQLKDILS